MLVTTSFANEYGPALGLSPTIKIRQVEDGSLVASGVMNEMGNGFYTYDFYEYEITKDYAILCDSIILVNKYRFKFMSSGEYGSVINNVDMLSYNTDVLITLIKKILMNRLELNDGNALNWTLYDDDGGILLRWDVADKLNSTVVQRPFDVSGRTRGG